MSLLNLFSALFRSKPERVLPEVGQVLEPVSRYSAPGLGAISADLDRAASFLLAGDVHSIRTAIGIVQDVSARVTALAATGTSEANRNDLRNIEDQLRRTRRLAEGAMRVQWVNLRRVLALTQSYAPPGRLSHFKDRWTRIDVKV